MGTEPGCFARCSPASLDHRDRRGRLLGRQHVRGTALSDLPERVDDDRAQLFAASGLDSRHRLAQ
jgi:hypothetical protein